MLFDGAASPTGYNDSVIHPDGTYVSHAWNPSREQLDRYKEREIALCRAVRRREPKLPQTASLFSVATWAAAEHAS